MKPIRTRALITIVCILASWTFPSSILASVEIDGIFYDLNTSAKTAAVVSNPDKYSGAIDIPSSFVYNGDSYNVKSIGSQAFKDCLGITSVIIPNSVTELGYYAFLNCTGLTSVTIGNSVTSIGWQTFKGCVGLTSVIIPNSVTSIGDFAFYDCTGLSSVDIPNSVTIISYFAFGHCANLTSIDIPNSVTFIDSSAFNGCSGLTSIRVDTNNEVYDSRNNCNAIIETSTNTLTRGCKNTVFPSNVINIAPYAFANCTGLTSIEIPNCVTSIGSTAFGECTDLASVIIPNSVASIGSCAFGGCKSLTNVEIPSSVMSVQDLTFQDCTSLASVSIPSSVTSIGRQAFEGCSGLSSIIVERETPASVINSSSFEGVDKTNCALYVPFGSKTTYENAAYWNEFKNIKESPVLVGTLYYHLNISDKTAIVDKIADENYSGPLTIPESIDYAGNTYIVTEIGEGAFSGCVGLTSVTIPGNVTSIGESAFSECTSLASMRIPDSVTYIGVYAFVNTEWYNNQPDGLVYGGKVAYRYKGEMPEGTTIAIRNGTASIAPWAFAGYENLISVTIPNSVITIGNSAFHWCSGLTSLTIPNSVTSIGKEAFDQSGLISVTIGSGVTSIGWNAFLECTNLLSVTVRSETPASLDSSFDGVDLSNCILYVPKGSKSAYANASGWGMFRNIIEYEPDTDISALDNVIYVEQTEGCIGGTMDIPVKVKNSYDFRGFQFTMELPEGSTINSWKLSTNRLPEGAALSDMFSPVKIDGNKINVACSLNYGVATFTGNDGEIGTVNVTFANDMEVGEYPIYLTACDISDASGTDKKLADIKATLVLDDYVVGDANGDGEVLIGDVIAILNYIVGVTSNNFNEKAADANGDGEILIGDVITVLNIIVSQ